MKTFGKITILLAITLFLFTVFSIFTSNKAYAIEEPDPSGNFMLALTVHLRGNVPSGVKVIASRDQVQATSGYQNTYTLSELNSTTYGANQFQPFNTGSPNCASVLVNAEQNGASYALLQFKIVVSSSDGTVLATVPTATYKCGSQDVYVNLNGSTPTSSSKPASLSGTVYICNGSANASGDCSGSLDKATNYTAAGAQTNPSVTLNPGGLTSNLNSSGQYSFSGLVSGVYKISGFVADASVPDKSFGFNNISFNLRSGSNTENIVINANSPGTAVATTTTPNGSSGGGGGLSSPTCESSGTSLSWIMCPIINGIANAVDGIYSALIQPLLFTKPIYPLNSSNPIFNAWSNFREYGDLLLLIGILVVVYSETIGGGAIEAFSAKRMLPRIVLAAILINLSIYIVAAAIDITNIIGVGIAHFIEQPFKSSGGFTLTLNGGASATGLAGIGLTALVTGAGIWGLASTSIALGPMMQMFLVFILLPTLLTFIAILATVLIRRGLILFLVIISPLALALYVLPNTEKYFKKWWELLFKTLLVFPIIAIVFAIANILSYTIDKSGQTSGLIAAISGLMAMVALVVPLFLIPFSFRIAGGAIGSFAKTIGDFRSKAYQGILGNPNDPNSLRNKTKLNARSQMIAARGRIYENLSEKTKLGTNGGRRIRRQLYRAAAGTVAMGNLQAERARINEEQDRMIASIYNNGDDAWIRAFWAEKYDGSGEANGRQIGGFYSPYQEPDGTYKEWSRSDVEKARSLVSKDHSKLQSYAKHEFNKAADAGQIGTFKQRFLDIANGYRLTTKQANDIWGGVKFAHQNTRKEQKFDSIIKGPDGRLAFKGVDQFGFSRELVDTVTKGGFVPFRDTTAMAAIEGYTSARNQVIAAAGGSEAFDRMSAADQDGLANRVLSANDREVYNNYRNLADHLNTSLFGPGGSAAIRNAQAQAMLAAQEEGEQPGLYGLGAAQRPEQLWREFTLLARRSGGPAAGGVSPGGVILPPFVRT